jgi:hypothetical protein
MVALHRGVEAVGGPATHRTELPGVVDQHIDASVAGGDAGADGTHFVEDGEVRTVGRGHPSARLTHGLDRPAQSLPITPEQHDLVAAAGQADRRGQADARARAGHDNGARNPGHPITTTHAARTAAQRGALPTDWG